MHHKEKPTGISYELLEHIHKKPGMYLCSPRLSSLHDFLTGFSVGQHAVGETDNNRFPSSDFSAWFCYHHQSLVAGAGGWYGAVMAEMGDEKKAFNRFFEHLATYRRRVPMLEYHFALRPMQRKYYATGQRLTAPVRLRLTRYKGENVLFLHARYRGQDGWKLHTCFTSLTQPRRWLAKVFGITVSQWEGAKIDAS